MRPTGLRHEEGGCWTADPAAGGGTARASTRMLVNTAGICIDEIDCPGAPTAKRRIHGAKGMHIAIRLPERCDDWACITYSTDDGPLPCAPFDDVHHVRPSEVD